MRKNKKNWEIFSKSVKNNAIVCDHIPTTPALITTTFNNGDSMMVETMNEGRSKYKVDLLNEVNLNKNFLESVEGTVYLMADHRTVAGMNKYENKVAKLENNGFTSFDFHYQNGFFIGHFKRKVAQ